MSNMNGLEAFADVLDIVEDVQDQSVVQEGGERYLPPEGETYGRFVGYIEYGPQWHTYQGNKKMRKEVRLTFELLGKRDLEANEGKGALIQSPPMTLSMHSKAVFPQWFKQMKYGREDVKHMAKMLGEPFAVRIIHNKVVDKNDPTKTTTFANIEYVGKPVYINEDEEVVEKKVPARTTPLRLFIWDMPTWDTWKSLYIDGEYQNADKTTTSKNKIQEKILASPEYKGSKLEVLLEAPTEFSGMDDVPF